MSEDLPEFKLARGKGMHTLTFRLFMQNGRRKRWIPSWSSSTSRIVTKVLNYKRPVGD